MLYLVIVGFSGIIFSFLLLKFRHVFFNLLEASVGLANEVLSDHDERVKQKKLISALKNILVTLGLVIITTLLILLATSAPIFMYSNIAKVNFENLDLNSGLFFGSLSLGSILPFFFKKKNKLENYSEFSMLLHKLILDNYYLGRFLLSFDKKFKSDKTIKNKDLFLVISGLARAGTTSITDQLFKAGKFSSLDYSNMPFLLAPNLWKKLYNPKKAKLKERKHGDKMLFGLNTIEALEEYFFKAFFNDNFIKKDSLVKHELNQDIYDSYIKYQSLIRNSNSHVYLAKNNNLILRYLSLRSFNKTFKTVFLFRNPIDHAYSLLNQHLRFSEFQKSDAFITNYMNWLGHHEFGEKHKVFSFDSNLEKIDYDITTLNYWLSVWLNYYTYLNNLNDSSFTLIEYKDYLEKPVEVLKFLGSEMKMDFDLSNIIPFSNEKKIDISNCDSKLLSTTNNMYQKLKKKKITF